MDRFGWTFRAEPNKKHILLVRLWNPPANDPEARRAGQCGLDVRIAAVAANPRANDSEQKPTTEGNQLATGGNQLATGGKAAEMPPMKSIGSIGPDKPDGTFREVRFEIPAELIGDKDHLAVRFFRQRDRVPGLVGEVRLLREP
jgi:hypothetical protein